MGNKNCYQDVPFGTRNGQPNVIPSALVIAHTERIDYVLNIMQSILGVAVMAIPRDGRSFIEWTQEERLTFFEEAETGFAQMSIPPEECFRELLLNQGYQSGQTIPPPHLHLFLGKENFLLNWGKDGFPQELSVCDFTGNVPNGQYNLYKRGSEAWNLIPRPDLNSLLNPKREGVYPILVDGKLFPLWQNKLAALRLAYSY